MKEGSYKRGSSFEAGASRGDGSFMQKCVVKEVPCEGSIYEVDILQ
jgi:hypothetical protein